MPRISEAQPPMVISAEPLDGLPGLARKDREKSSWRSDVQIFVA